MSSSTTDGGTHPGSSDQPTSEETAPLAAEGFTTVDRPTGPRRAREGPRFSAAWGTVLLWSELAFIAVGIFGEILAFGQVIVGGLSPGFGTTARVGGLYFFAFHHVPIDVTATGSAIHHPLLAVSVSLLLGTALGATLLFRGGMIAGERTGGGPAARAVVGLTLGIPYAGLSLLLSYAVGFRVTNSLFRAAGLGDIVIGVPHLQAFLWPLAIGAAAGALGGVWSARSLSAESLWGRRARLATGGGLVMFLTAMVLAFVGLLALAAIHPDQTRAYLDATAGGGTPGVDMLAHHVLALPNQSTWVLVPAMGGCDTIEGQDGGSFLCYSKFPMQGSVGRTLSQMVGLAERGPPLQGYRFESAPPGYFLFLLVPLGAVLAGGVWAGRRAEDRGEGMVAGATAGVVFAGLVAFGAVLAGVRLVLHPGAGQESGVTLGPDPAAGFLLALVWGVVGGALGALAGAARPLPERRATAGWDARRRRSGR